jgi:hypothetical protein
MSPKMMQEMMPQQGMAANVNPALASMAAMVARDQVKAGPPPAPRRPPPSSPQLNPCR